MFSSVEEVLDQTCFDYTLQHNLVLLTIYLINYFKPMRAQTVILRGISIPKVRQNI